MNSRVKVDDRNVIPARLEGTLARRWSALAVKEGHKPKLPGTDARARANGATGVSGANHRNTIKAAHNKRVITAALQDGPLTVVQIREATGFTHQATQAAVAKLGKQGVLQCVGYVDNRKNGPKIWALMET
jgi:predicted Rossmann fold nucleotide-binding protein DprA/Smf involved in DNA uptake